MEKHINWKYLLALICVAVSFRLGFECNNADRDKLEANMILEHAREISEHAKELTAYRDSAIAAKLEAHDAVDTYKWMVFYKDRTIDSLKNVIRLMANENKDRHK